MITDRGYSLNDLLLKGRNNLNRLVQIFTRWLIYACAFHTDVQNYTISLVIDHWCYQLFLWEDELNINVKPFVCVIKTLIYGVRISGNQAERAIRETANLFKNKYPRQNEIIQKDTYVDDCLSGENSLNDAKKVREVTQLWFPKSDLLSLNISELNFGKSKGLIPKKFTRRECASRVGGILDLVRRFAPLVGEFKLDLHEVSFRKLEWDDFIPDDLMLKWADNFEIISKLSEIKFQRCIVPEDAVSLDMETLEMDDASLNTYMI